MATPKNLQSCLRDEPVGLHFSGHGYLNEESLYQGDQKGWLKYKGKGDVLIFENENGASEFFFTTDLQDMFADIKSQLTKLRTQKVAEDPPLDALLDTDEAAAERSGTLKLPGGQSESMDAATSLQLVYVASCHSEEAGKIFLEAGVPHVICIDSK